MLRIAAGLGGSGVHYESSVDNSIYDGTDWDNDSDWGGAGFFSFDVGASPIENFVLHFRMSHYGVFLDESLGRWDYAALSIWGAGATWYFMPVNLYLTATLGIGVGHLMAVDEDGPDEDYEPEDVDVTDGFGGFGCGIDVGKEWWVGGSWGIGVAGRIHFVTVDYFSSTAFGVLFSATYQ